MNLFDKHAECYSKHRPTYPDALFRYISSLCLEHEVAWDVATGNGQAAKELSRYFKNVIGSDSSEEQLKFAVENASNIYYFQASAESPSDELKTVVKKLKPSGRVDLITVAQAIHWFDFPKFYEVVNEFLEAETGIFACWCYASPDFFDKDLNDIFYYIYDDILGKYWANERKYVEEMYETLPGFDKKFNEIQPPKEILKDLRCDCHWSFNDCLDYIKTWSAYQKAFQIIGEPVPKDILSQMKKRWVKDGIEIRKVSFPIYLKVGSV